MRVDPRFPPPPLFLPLSDGSAGRRAYGVGDWLLLVHSRARFRCSFHFAPVAFWLYAMEVLLASISARCWEAADSLFGWLPWWLPAVRGGSDDTFVNKRGGGLEVGGSARFCRRGGRKMDEALGSGALRKDLVAATCGVYESINGGEVTPLLSLVDGVTLCFGAVSTSASCTSWPPCQIGGTSAAPLRRPSPVRLQVVLSPATAPAAMALCSSSSPVERGPIAFFNLFSGSCL